LTPAAIDFSHAAAAWGIAFARVETVQGFSEPLVAALQRGGPHLIEVVVDLARSVHAHRAYWAAVGRS
jgi:2-succinyl-5-enolpyruvyl-6-hydroxy-3-cyclohexene-1-carboxylate synthase